MVDAVGETPGSLAMGNIYPCADEAWPSIRRRRRVAAGGGLRLWCRGSGSAGLRAGVEEGAAPRRAAMVKPRVGDTTFGSDAEGSRGPDGVCVEANARSERRGHPSSLIFGR